MAEKLGVIRQTVNTWISDIRARQRSGREIVIIRLNRLACPPSFLSAVFVADWRVYPPLEGLDPRADRGGGGDKPG